MYLDKKMFLRYINIAITGLKYAYNGFTVVCFFILACLSCTNYSFMWLNSC